MSAPADERVLVVPTELFRRIGHFQGFCGDVGRYLPELLSPENTIYRSRREVENDPDYKQLIPYVIFCHRDQGGVRRVFPVHPRVGDGRGPVAPQAGVGIGRHISAIDGRARLPVHRGDAARWMRGPDRYALPESPGGTINDDETEVGRVHLGVVHLFDVDDPRVHRGKGIIECGFRPVEEILASLAGFETWSQISIRVVRWNGGALLSSRRRYHAPDPGPRFS